MNCNTTHYRANSSSVPGDPTQELADATQAFNRDRGPHARLRLALLLSVPGTGLEDEARSATLLEPMLGLQGPYREVASFLSMQLAERTRERRRTAQLKEQLDALREVDRSLIDRGQSKGK